MLSNLTEVIITFYVTDLSVVDTKRVFCSNSTDELHYSAIFYPSHNSTGKYYEKS